MKSLEGRYIGAVGTFGNTPVDVEIRRMDYKLGCDAMMSYNIGIWDKGDGMYTHGMFGEGLRTCGAESNLAIIDGYALDKHPVTSERVPVHRCEKHLVAWIRRGALIRK